MGLGPFRVHHSSALVDQNLWEKVHLSIFLGKEELL